MVSKLPFRGVPFNLRHMLSRENRRVETSLKCCMAFRTPLARPLTLAKYRSIGSYISEWCGSKKRR